MSDQIETYRIQQYRDGIDLLAQQKMSRYRGKTRFEGGLKGKVDFIDQAGQTSMVQRSGRGSATDRVDADLYRRRVTHTFWSTSQSVGRDDIQDVLNDPTGTYGRMQAAAMARRTDQTMADAAFATAYSGENGADPVPFPAALNIASGAVGLNTAKTIEAKRILDANEVDDSGRFAMCTAKQLADDLLTDTEFQNSDYNSVKALVNGDASTWMGFDFERFEGQPIDGSSDRSCCFWQRDSLLLAVRDTYTRVSELEEQHYDWQVYTSFEVGATRLDELGVVEVECRE